MIFYTRDNIMNVKFIWQMFCGLIAVTAPFYYALEITSYFNWSPQTSDWQFILAMLFASAIFGTIGSMLRTVKDK